MGNAVSDFVKKNPCSCSESSATTKIEEEVLQPITVAPAGDMASLVGSKLYMNDELLAGQSERNSQTKLKAKMKEASFAAQKKAQKNPQKAIKLKNYYQRKLFEINQKERAFEVPNQHPMILTGSVVDTRAGSVYATLGQVTNAQNGNRGSSSVIQSSIDGGSSMRILHNNKLNWAVLSAKQLQSPPLTNIGPQSNKSLMTTTQLIEKYRRESQNQRPNQRKLETVMSAEYEEGLSGSQLIDPSPANQGKTPIVLQKYQEPIDAVTEAEATPSNISHAKLTSSLHTGFQAYTKLKGVSVGLTIREKPNQISKAHHSLIVGFCPEFYWETP